MHRREIIKSLIVGSIACSLDYNKGFSRILLEESGLKFQSQWSKWKDLKWVGPEYWGNRMQDWIIKDGQVVHDVCGPNRTLHLMPVQNRDGDAAMEMQVGINILDSAVYNYEGHVGFRLGANGPFEDYRSASVFGKGTDIGVSVDGQLLIAGENYETGLSKLPEEFLLHLSIGKKDDGNLALSLSIRSYDGKNEMYNHPPIDVKPEILKGNVALLSHFETKLKGEESRSVSFSDWRISSPDLQFNEDQVYGPVCFAQYTLHRSILKITAQLTPIENIKDHEVILEFYEKGKWFVARKTVVTNPGRAVNFRITDWDKTENIPYRIRLLMPSEEEVFEYIYKGTIAAEPLNQEKVKLAVFSCNAHYGFPDADIVESVFELQPDIAVFLGDQFYEGTGGFGAQFGGDFDKACIDYLRKWLMFGWSYREIFRDIPCAIIPDDHDVYHGNVWGESGKEADISGGYGASAQDSGGYKQDAQWVNMVQFTQTSHLPDPFDPTPVKQNISVYYTHWNYGGISFAILEDRKFKSAPKNILPVEAQVNNGWILNEDFDIKEFRDLEAELLGPRQEYFLEEWAEDWSHQAAIKVVLSQTNFATVATLPEGAKTGAVIPSLPIPEKGEYVAGDRPTVDMDSNGWPPPKRDKAIETIRKAFAFHIAGDQHLASFIQYGLKEHGDSGFAFAGPALNNLWPRRFWPSVDHSKHTYEDPAYVGDHIDGFGNKMTVRAIGNPHNEHKEPAILYNRAVGFGLVTFDKKNRTIETACYRRFKNPSDSDAQFSGWPITIDQRDNYKMDKKYFLPTFYFYSTIMPLVKVFDSEQELIYALRMNGPSFQPWVAEEGQFNVVVEIPETGKQVVYNNIEAKKENLQKMEVIYR
jgi:hypothetical protein